MRRDNEELCGLQTAYFDVLMDFAVQLSFAFAKLLTSLESYTVLRPIQTEQNTKRIFLPAEFTCCETR